MADPNSPPLFQPPPVPPLPMVIDGADRDVVLTSSAVLTRQEVLERRSRRVKKLARIYREHYWALTEEVRRKYREYYGKSPFKEDEKEV